MEWSKSVTIKLIELYKDKSMDSNSTYAEYKNKQKKFDALIDIAKEL